MAGRSAPAAESGQVLRLAAATRGSALAIWQTEEIGRLLAAARPGAGLDAVVIDTTADQRLDIPIWEMGGKGVFVKEVQAAVLDGRARVAVHSGKDMPSAPHDELVVAAVPARGDHRDVLVGSTLDGLVPGAPVATGSVRRRAQLANLRPDLTFTGLRGNIATRLGKIPPGGAIVMAAAALDRLALWDELAAQGIATEILGPDVMLPQVAQGALAVECRADDAGARELLALIDDPVAHRLFDAERGFLAELGGDCNLPAGAWAEVSPPADGRAEVAPAVVLRGLLAGLDGHVVLRHEERGQDAEKLGRTVARHLLDDAGGAALLDP
jgi:hydroxymethylbilane synthase